MRIVFAGVGPMTVMTTRALLKQGHEVVVIELSKEKIDRLSDELDCSFIHGDASKPAVLSQVDPKSCDFLFCLTDSDQVNIITALLGRSMGFQRVVPSIENAELQQLCSELQLGDTIIPARTMSQYLENMVHGLDIIELSTFLKHDARLFSFTLRERIGTLGELELPSGTKAIFYYRGDEFHFVQEETRFKKGDEIVILTHSRNLQDLRERWNPSKQEEKAERAEA